MGGKFNICVGGVGVGRGVGAQGLGSEKESEKASQRK